MPTPKCQKHSDNLLTKLGLIQSKKILPLFRKLENGELKLLVAKVVDDLKISGSGSELKNFLLQFQKKFKHGTVSQRPE